MTTTKIAPGFYETAEGHTIEWALDGNEAHTGEWHLISPTGEWSGTFATKRDALASLTTTITRSDVVVRPEPTIDGYSRIFLKATDEFVGSVTKGYESTYFTDWRANAVLDGKSVCLTRCAPSKTAAIATVLNALNTQGATS